MIYLKMIIQLIGLSILCLTVHAQQFPIYSQYTTNGFLINPSLAGRDGYTSINLTIREQWVGLSMAPATYAASFQARMLKASYINKTERLRKRFKRAARSGNVGIGGYVFSDENGIIRRSGVSGAYSYHIPMGKAYDHTNDFALGLAATFYQLAINTKNLNYDQDDDQLFSYDWRHLITDINFGASFTTNKYFVGFSMTNILRGQLLFAGASTNSDRVELGHYFLTGGLKIPLDKDLIFEPSAFIKSSDMFFQSMQLDLTSRIYYKRNYWAGLSWRTGDAIIVLAGFRVNSLFIAYAYDITLTDMRAGFGSHEISIAYKFGKSDYKYRWVNSF